MVVPTEIVEFLADTQLDGGWLLLLILLWHQKKFQEVLGDALIGSIELIRLANMMGQIVILILLIFVKLLDLLSRHDDGEPPDS